MKRSEMTILFVSLLVLFCFIFFFRKHLTTSIEKKDSRYLKNFQFQGIDCPENSFYPGECPYPQSCCCSSSCVLYTSGIISLDAQFTQPKTKSQLLKVFENSIPPCSANFNEEGYFSRGYWRINQTNCDVTRFTNSQAHFLLQDSIIVVVGDSMMRQLYHRLIWFLRGFNEVVEHYYHFDAVYSRNHTHDKFNISDQSNQHQIDHIYNQVINPVLVVHYIWDVDVGHSIKKVENIYRTSKLQKRIYIAGIHHWRYDKADGESVAISSLLQSSNASLFWYSAPNPYHHVGVDERNEFYNNFTQSMGGSVLPGSLMWKDGTFSPNAEDKIHYQCSYRVPLGIKIPKNEYKTPKNGDCRDLFNLNLVYMILNQLLIASV